MDETLKTTPCKECTNREEKKLNAEVEHLKKLIGDQDAHIQTLETELEASHAQSSDLHLQLDTWQEKYERLYDSHKRVQTLNQVLEDKLLQMVDRMKNEKTLLTKDIATLSVRLAESKHGYTMLQKENERYKNDMNLAIQLLQCKPDNFVSHKLDNLPLDTQARVSQYVMSKTKPTTSSSSLTKNGNEIDSFDASEYEFNISASLVSKILEDSVLDTVTKHCDTCTCSKTQNKPFCYNDTHYSIATQTTISGDMRNSLCMNCNADVNSVSHLSTRSGSPHVVRLAEKNASMFLPGPLYVVPQPAEHTPKVCHENEKAKSNPVSDIIKTEEQLKLDGSMQNDIINKIGDELKQIRKSNGLSMEPAVHHKLCDRTKTPISSKKSSNSFVNEDVSVKDLPLARDPKVDIQMVDNISIRKNSHSSMGAVSRTSSIAKSTSSTHRSNTQVGPGPRFCSLRMQAGSKNILLDNAQPDVPPVLYRRQSKCNDNTIFKELGDGIDTFIDIGRNNDVPDNFFKDDNNVVVDSTLVDVHVDNNVKESNASVKHPIINPVLMNVSSSPLQPLKTHTFSNSSEKNNNFGRSIESQKNVSEVDNLLKDFNLVNNNVKDTKYNDIESNITLNKTDEFSPAENQDIRIFNFDRYEQNKLPSAQYARPLRKIDMAHLHSLENTKISKDYPPHGEVPKIPKKDVSPTSNNANVINVYPNLTQTHLKVNDKKKVFTNEQSTSSLSSDDSAAILQKQQLLRVAEWVEQNLEQQNNFNDPLVDEDSSFSAKIARRESRLNRLTDTLNELALNMPHPVSKYSKKVIKDKKNCNNNFHETQTHQHVIDIPPSSRINHVAKETIFPVEAQTNDAIDDSNIVSDDATNMKSNDHDSKENGEKEITADDLARMEYNVKKFLMSGSQWANTEPVGRSRRTSSKTETDV